MSRIIRMAPAISLWLVLYGTSARADMINFEDGANLGGTAIGSHYLSQGVTFSNSIWITSASTGISNNEFWDGNAGLGVANGVQNPNPWAFPGTTSPIVISFSSAMANVSIRVFDVGTNGAGLHAFDASGNLIGTDNAQGTGAGFFNNLTLAVTAAGIRSIHLDQPFYSGFPDGIGWDNLSFAPASVPEPSSLGLVGIMGMFGGIGCLWHRRKRTAA
jgi:hypothetical protein